MIGARRLVPSLQRWLNLRTLLLLLFVSAAVYAFAVPTYLMSRLGAAATVLSNGIRHNVKVRQDFTAREQATERATRIAQRALTLRAPDVLLIDSLPQLAGVIGTPLGADELEGQSPAVHDEIVRADSQFGQVAEVLREMAVLLRNGDRHAVADRVAFADRLGQLAIEQSRLEARQGRDDLLAQQLIVDNALAEIHRDLLLWLVLGVLLMGLALFSVRRRIWHPLRALEIGLAQVAEGELNTQLPVTRMDETGRLAAHFNQMTTVLRNRAEEQGRFAAAGELLAGVAHEVNNPLMAIAAHAENRLADGALTSEQREEMQQVLRQAQRATKLLRGLLRFVRSTERRLGSVNLNDVVRGALDLVSYRFGVDEITVGGHLDAALPPVIGDAIRLEQVLVNLLSNAIDALRLIKPPRHLSVDTWVDGERVSVAVADTGPGIPAEVEKRLFRPFATTKGRRGTGLGLYISRQIAREAGGDLALANAPRAGGGARFVMTLPAGSLPTAPEARAATSGGKAQGRLAGIRALIVDDEEPVRKPMARFLKRRGAEVAEASDGAEALSWLERNDADVIIADLRMPRMSGTELFAALETKRPHLAHRILFLSGDVSQLAEPGSTPVPRERVLVKPVELGQLEERVVEFVREVADRAGGPAGAGGRVMP